MSSCSGRRTPDTVFVSCITDIRLILAADKARNIVASAGSSSKPFDTKRSSFLVAFAPALFLACGFLSGFVRAAPTTMDRLLAGACGGVIGQVAELCDFRPEVCRVLSEKEVRPVGEVEGRRASEL